jgi:hypothetical protein
METKAAYTLTQVEERDLPARIMEMLSEHKGIGNAITGLRIARRFGYRNDRKVRMVIQQLIAEGKPIAASVSEPVGYYLVQTRDEAEAYEAVLRSRATKTFERLRDFQRAINNEFGVPLQPFLIPVDTGPIDTAQAIRDADAREMW